MTPDTLLLRPLPGKLEWCCPNEAQPPVIVEQAAYLQPNALADLPDAGNACLFLSPDYFCFRRVELPTENYKISEQTLGWLVEDAVVGDTDSLHWTVLAREENTLHLAGIARTTLNDLLTTFRTAGVTLTYIVPDGFWLPYVTDSWSLLKQDERWLIRYDAWKTGVLSEALLTHLLASHTEQKSSAPARFLCLTLMSNTLTGSRRWRAPAMVIIFRTLTYYTAASALCPRHNRPRVC